MVDCPEPGGTGTGQNRGYFTVSPPSSPHVTSLYWGPQSCCCDDPAGTNLLDLLVAFILVRKTANSQIFKAQKAASGSCKAVEIQWEFGAGGASPQSVIDQADILAYYLALFAAL